MVGVQPALVFGICAFFGEFVPNVGPLVAAIPAIFVAISMGPTKAAMALGVIIFVQAIASNALNPIIMGREMKLHPVSITFFALAMGKLFGVAGAILAVPTAAVSKILIDEFYLRPRGVNEGTVEEQARGIVMNEAGVED
jgi:predicted PurR-regulated permease PerM